MEDPDAILVRSQDMHKIKIPDSVKAVGRAGAGVNNIPIADLTNKGVPVLNTPGANSNAVRELVIAGMLLASRNIYQAWDYVRNLSGPDEEINKRVEKDKKQFVGFELLGKTLGIIGLGNVGVKVANAAINLGMKVIGFDPTISVNRAWELSANVEQAHNLIDIFLKSDFVTIHVPLSKETKNLIDAEKLNCTTKGLVLLNFSREGIVNTVDLEQALNDKKILSYVTDFPSEHLIKHPNVVSLPHLGASTHEAEENSANMIVRQIRDLLENGNINNSVNFPNLEMPFNNAKVRLAVVNANVPNMVAQISSCLASVDINIISLINKSRDAIAYTLVDINSDVPNSVEKQISDIKGVIHVRKITPGKTI
jgi:D-3-phosphoglycerate dehydrogenase